jgi:hypothetical protein
MSGISARVQRDYFLVLATMSGNDLRVQIVQRDYFLVLSALLPCQGK